METKNYSWDEFQKIARDRDSAGEYSGKHWGTSSLRTSNREWYQSRSLSEALDIAEKGWPEGTRKLMESAGMQSAIALPDMVPVKHYDVSGEYPDVGAYCAGEIENMVSLENGMSDIKPVIKIAFAGCISAFVNPDHITNYGIAALSLIDAVQRSGRSVSLHWIWMQHLRIDGGTPMSVNVNISEPSTPLDIDRLAFALGHPSMARRLCFAVLESIDERIYRGSYSGGPPAPLTAKNFPEFNILFPEVSTLSERGLLSSPGRALSIVEGILAKSGLAA
jgi:hypothetical protein